MANDMNASLFISLPSKRFMVFFNSSPAPRNCSAASSIAVRIDASSASLSFTSRTPGIGLDVLGKRCAHQIRVGTTSFADEELLRLDEMLQKLSHRTRIFRRLKSKLIGRNLISFVDQAVADFAPAFDDIFN